MATLYDLAMQYLNQSLPKTFKYDRTNPPTIGPRLPVQPEDPNAPVKKILPVQGGGGGGGSNNPYNLSTDFSQITSDRQKRLSQDPTGLNKFLIDTLGMQKPQTAEDIVNLGYRTPSKFGIGALLPDKYGELPRADQAFIASRMGYTGPTVFGANDSGLSKDPFGLNTRSAFGNYAERVGVEAEKALDNLNRLGDKYNATWNDELGTYVGPGAKKANQMTSMIQSKRNFYTGEDAAYKDYQNQVQNVLDANKEFSIEGDSSNYGIDGYPTYDIKDIQGEDDEEFDPTAPLNLNTTTAPPFMNFYNPYKRDNIVDEFKKQQDAIKQQELIDQNAMDPGTVVDNSAPPNNNPNEDHDGDGVPNNVEAAGGSYDGGYQGAEGGFEYTGDFGDQYSDANYMAGDTSSDNTPNPGDTDTFNTETGNENDSGSNTGTHCCTAANERGDMTLLEVKKLRVWHRKQSKIWQRGYDVWGRVMADNLVSKYKWSSDRVRDFYNHKIYGKRTIGSTFADFCIYPMSMIIGSILTVMPPILGYQENKRHGKSSS